MEIISAAQVKLLSLLFSTIMLYKWKFGLKTQSIWVILLQTVLYSKKKRAKPASILSLKNKQTKKQTQKKKKEKKKIKTILFNIICFISLPPAEASLFLQASTFTRGQQVILYPLVSPKNSSNN